MSQHTTEMPNSASLRSRRLTLLILAGVIVAMIAGVVEPGAWNREAVEPVASLAIPAASMGLAIAVTVVIGIVRRYRQH